MSRDRAIAYVTAEPLYQANADSIVDSPDADTSWMALKGTDGSPAHIEKTTFNNLLGGPLSWSGTGAINNDYTRWYYNDSLTVTTSDVSAITHLANYTDGTNTVDSTLDRVKMIYIKHKGVTSDGTTASAAGDHIHIFIHDYSSPTGDNAFVLEPNESMVLKFADMQPRYIKLETTANTAKALIAAICWGNS